jgi:serine/threonine protein kinase
MVGDKCQIERCLDIGGTGFVLEGRHVLNEQKVAVKVIHPLPANSPEIVECFLRELRVFARVQKGQSALAPLTGPTSTSSSTSTTWPR